MTAHRPARRLCPHGCDAGYLPAGVTDDGELLDRRPCPSCQSTRLTAMARARDALGPAAVAAARRRFGRHGDGLASGDDAATERRTRTRPRHRLGGGDLT
jgi:hypothetical protein